MAIVFALIPIIVLVSFYSYAAPGTIAEPSITWNLYVAPVMTALTSALILFFVSRKFKGRDQKEDQIAKLLEEREATKEAHIRERWESFTETQCAIKTKLDAVAKDLTNKVDWTHCNHEMEKIEDRMRP